MWFWLVESFHIGDICNWTVEISVMTKPIPHNGKNEVIYSLIHSLWISELSQLNSQHNTYRSWIAGTQVKVFCMFVHIALLKLHWLCSCNVMTTTDTKQRKITPYLIWKHRWDVFIHIIIFLYVKAKKKSAHRKKCHLWISSLRCNMTWGCDVIL